MLIKFKPMLATQITDLSALKYPVFASKKLDGVRCCVFDGVGYSRSLKHLPNQHLQNWVKANAEALEGLDGEIIVGEPTDECVFKNTVSFVMSIEKVQDFRFYVFDIIKDGSETKEALVRQKLLEGLKGIPGVVVLEQVLIPEEGALEAFRTDAVALGYEGAMVKALNGKYKFGRSSVKEGLLLKMKLFTDKEFLIVGYDCKYLNENEATENELGRSTRSTKKEGKVPTESLGVLYLVTKDGVKFGCGSGFSDESRLELWGTREALIGKYATVKYFDVGGYDVPRFAVFKGIRDVENMV